jgi:hypothetical protein
MKNSDHISSAEEIKALLSPQINKERRLHSRVLRTCNPQRRTKGELPDSATLPGSSRKGNQNSPYLQKGRAQRRQAFIQRQIEQKKQKSLNTLKIKNIETSKSILMSNSFFEFTPSDELVLLVQASIGKQLAERKSILRESAAEGRRMPDDIPAQDSGRLVVTGENVRRHISESVADFLITLGRGLASGGEKAYPLSRNQRIRDEVMKGFLYRIPIRLSDAPGFNTRLSEDLYLAAKHDQLKSDYARLIIDKHGELILEATTIVEPAKPSTWQRATIYHPE